MGHLTRRILYGHGESVAGTLYGTIVVMSLIAAGSKNTPWRLAIFVAGGALTFWIAHVYAHGLGESLERGHRLDRAELTAIARRELAIVLAAVVPVVALVLGGLGVFDEDTAIWLALCAGLVTLAVDGVRYARLERIGRLGAVGIVAANLSLGLVIVALKVVVSH